MTNSTTDKQVLALPVDCSNIATKHVKERYTSIALTTLATVGAAKITSAIKMAAKHVGDMVANHKTPNGSDVKRTVKMWQSRQNVSMILAMFAMFDMGKPSDAVQRIWLYATKTSAQRSGNVYMALKAQDKFLALAGWLLSGDPLTAKAKNKYLVSIIVLMETLNISTIDNSTVYALYVGAKSRIDALSVDMDSELREMLLDAKLYKGEATASTQRTTSANLIQALGAGVNAGNDRTITIDRESAVYVALRNSIFGSK